MNRRLLLGVNIDHVATLREARRVTYPDPVEAARFAERGGADGITVHLREDRRHINDRDVERGHTVGKLNLEMAATAEMRAKAVALRPDDACIVPERRVEVTTEGGLDAAGQGPAPAISSRPCRSRNPRRLFIDPTLARSAAAESGATGRRGFATAHTPKRAIHTGWTPSSRGCDRQPDSRLRPASR